MLPILCLSIAMASLQHETDFQKYSVSYSNLDAYAVYNLTNEDKKAYILDYYNLSDYEFSVLCGIVLSEAQAGSYTDAYAVINTIYNRTHSKSWVNYISDIYNKSVGDNLYYQATAPNQFTVYKSGRYKKQMNNTKSDGYQAILDFLYSEETLHDYLSFRSHHIKIKNSEAFSPKGNNYFNLLDEKNRI